MAGKTYLNATLTSLVFLVVLGISGTAQGTIISVDDDGPADFTNIQAAINAAVDGDTVIVADGNYTGYGNHDIDFKGKAITVHSENGPEGCIIDCQGTEANPHRGFYFHSGEDTGSILDGFTITNGFNSKEPAAGYWAAGSGILCYQSNPTITNCIITGNIAWGWDAKGGGIFCKSSSPTITNCTFSANTACGRIALGGGLYSGSDSNPTIKNCTFSANSAEGNDTWGGGIHCSGGSFLSCIVIGNSAEDGGGGIDCLGNATITNCIITDNSANSCFGGGVYCWASNPTLINCTIARNWAKLDGGGIYSGWVARPTITQCTITDNSADRYGGGVTCWRSFAVIKSSIIHRNSASKGNQLTLLGRLHYWPSVVTVSYSNIRAEQLDIYVQDFSTLNWGDGNIGADPSFIDPDNGDYRLSSSSPCIDTAAPYYYLFGRNFADMEGDCRLAGSGVDIGSDEFGSSPDTDADLLSDADEAAYGSNPDNPDTDGDGLLDGVETLRGTNPVAANSPPGISVPAQYSTIQQALFLAFPLETVTVSPGTYYEGLHFQGKNLILQSINPLDNEIVDTTIIDANEVETVVTFGGAENSSCILNGFTITNGGYSGINGNGCKAVIQNNKIVRNFILSLNYGFGGGGVSDCDGLIQNNLIANNSAGSTGGGIDRCDGVIQNNMIINNFAGYAGGGISCTWHGTPVIRNCTIANNFAPRSYYSGGGAISVRYYSSPKVTNCILWGNTAPEIHLASKTYIVVTYSTIQDGWPGVGNIDADPLFFLPGYWDMYGVCFDGDYHLLPGSPCIDTGDQDYVPGPNETELDGKQRILDGNDDGIAVVDMGAYECRPPIPAQVDVEPETLNLASKGKWITCCIRLPEDYDVADIKPDMVLLENEIVAEHFLADEQEQVATVRFDRQQVQSILDIGEVELTITGQLTDGTAFEATDIIKVINKGAGKNK